MDAMELLDRYAKEVEIDTQIDATNIMEKQMSAPNMKHKWLFRLITAKKSLNSLVELKEEFITKQLNDNPLKMPISAIRAKVEKIDEVKEINKQIRDHDLLIEYLDKSVDKIFTGLGFDFRNLVELLKLEQL